MATNYAMGTDARLIGVSESTYGAAPDGAAGGVYQLLPFANLSFGQSRTLEEVVLLDGTRQANVPTYGAPNLNGDIAVGQDVRNLGWWLKRLMGAPTTTGTDPYTHVFVSETVDLPSAALEIGHPQLATPDYQMFTGVRLGGFNFQTSRNAPGLMTIPAIGKSAAGGVSPEDATPTSLAVQLFKTAKAELKIAGTTVANAADVNLAYNLNLDVNEGLAANGEIVGVEPSRPTLTGSLASRLGAGGATVRNQIQSDGAFELVLTKTVGAHSLEYRLAAVYLEESSVGVSGPGGVDVNYNFRAAYDASAGYMLQVTLVNDVASY